MNKKWMSVLFLTLAATAAQAQSSYDLPSRDPALRSIRDKQPIASSPAPVDLNNISQQLLDANKELSDVLSREADLAHPDWNAIEAAVTKAATAWKELNKAFEKLGEYNANEKVLKNVFIGSMVTAPVAIVAGIAGARLAAAQASKGVSRPLIGIGILALGVAAVSYSINEFSVRPAKKEFELRLATEFGESKKLLENLCSIFELSKSNGGQFDSSLNDFVTEACQELPSLKFKFGIADDAK